MYKFYNLIKDYKVTKLPVIATIVQNRWFPLNIQGQYNWWSTQKHGLPQDSVLVPNKPGVGKTNEPKKKGGTGTIFCECREEQLNSYLCQYILCIVLLEMS